MAPVTRKAVTVMGSAGSGDGELGEGVRSGREDGPRGSTDEEDDGKHGHSELLEAKLLEDQGHGCSTGGDQNGELLWGWVIGGGADVGEEGMEEGELGEEVAEGLVVGWKEVGWGTACSWWNSESHRGRVLRVSRSGGRRWGGARHAPAKARDGPRGRGW